MELQHHWRDVMFGFAHVIGEEFLPSTCKNVCVDATFIGNGDVKGNGARTLYIARQNANHFVPVLNAASVDEGKPIFRGSSSGNKSGSDATKASASRQSSAKAAVDLFNDRMNFIDSDYGLNEKEIALVTAEVKDLGSSEENFNSYKDKLEVIFAHKLKKNIEAKEAEIKARIDEAVASREVGNEPEEATTDDEESEEELEVEV